jgi:endonuclease/exonuclease/phosphatase family metal-dependent hydrolase
MGKALMLFGLFGFAGAATEPLLDSHEIHAVIGEPTRFVAALPDRPVKVVSWNIEQGVRYEQVLNALVAFDADIYLLQEVDSGVRRSKYVDVARLLARSLAMNWVFAGEFQEIGQAQGDVPAITGQAILSRFPIRGAVALPFENQATLRWKLDPTQPRRGGRIALKAESGGLVLYNTHIESAKNDAFRLKQVEEVILDHSLSPRADYPVVVAGDLNTSLPPERSPVVRGLTARGFIDALGTLVSKRRTSTRHEDPLDWIFVKNIGSRDGRVVEVHKASDHYPLEVLLGGAAVPVSN